MTGIRSVALTALVFLLVGPLIGTALILGSRGSIGVPELGLGYSFGGIPALIAAIAFGMVRNRSTGSLRWYTRVLWGACAGLFGGLLFFLLITAGNVRQDVHPWFDVRFLRAMVMAGVPAGAICGLLMANKSTTT
jgi:L-asparagine transporter-like permease